MVPAATAALPAMRRRRRPGRVGDSEPLCCAARRPAAQETFLRDACVCLCPGLVQGLHLPKVSSIRLELVSSCGEGGGAGGQQLRLVGWE